MCIEREKVNFKSRDVNCLKECALALNVFMCQFFLHLTCLLIYKLHGLKTEL